MPQVAEVNPTVRFRLSLRFTDGAAGEVDLSDFAGRGVFSVWQRPGVFERVRVNDVGGLEWPEGPDLCPDMLYMRLTGKSPEQVMPGLSGDAARA